MNSSINEINGVEKENVEVTLDNIIALFRAADDYCVSSKNLGKALDILNKSINPVNNTFHNFTIYSNENEKRPLIVEDDL